MVTRDRYGDTNIQGCAAVVQVLSHWSQAGAVLTGPTCLPHRVPVGRGGGQSLTFSNSLCPMCSHTHPVSQLTSSSQSINTMCSRLWSYPTQFSKISYCLYKTKQKLPFFGRAAIIHSKCSGKNPGGVSRYMPCTPGPPFLWVPLIRNTPNGTGSKHR